MKKVFLSKVIFAVVACVVCANALEMKPMKPIIIDHQQPQEINGKIVWVNTNN